VPGGILAILILLDIRYIVGIGWTKMETATSILSVAQGAIRIACRSNDGKMDGDLMFESATRLKILDAACIKIRCYWSSLLGCVYW
jgi:hypothetical protein